MLMLSVLVAEAVSAQSLASIKALAQSVQHFRASFTYTVSSPYWDDEEEHTGSLAVQGAQYRVETGTDVILSHGPDTYVYRPAENQVLITTGEPAFSPVTLFGNFEAFYEAVAMESVQYAGVRHHTVLLRPRDPDASVQEVAVWLRAGDGMITRVQSVDVNSTTMDIRLVDIDLNPRFAPDAFDLSFPESAEVIDLRS